MKRSTALRWSLLTSLGLLPLACADDEDAPNGHNAGTAGHTGEAASGSGGSTGGSAAIGKPPSCTSPTLDANGITTCSEGYRYREKPFACAFRADEGPTGGSGGAADSAFGGSSSSTMSPCTPACEGEHAYCDETSATPLIYVCSRGCLTDDECGDDQMCRCEGEIGGVCVAATCRGDDECVAGYHCAQAEDCGNSGGTFACQTPQDECVTFHDCEQTGCIIDHETSTHRVCKSYGACGRPFLIEAAVRTAPIAFRSDWQEPTTTLPRVAHLTTSERAALAEHWTKMGQMEHASIAAFARFSLQLLALGAPSVLVEDCTRALADETAHTKLCFRLASSYAGRAIGPGPLNVDRSLEVTSLQEIVELVIAEGCFGETSAALEALEAAEFATDPVIAAAYARIAGDEQRHAELAFRFVAWALERGGDQVRGCVAAACSAPQTSSRDVLAVAVPCLQALLGQAQRAGLARGARPFACAEV